MSPRRALYVVRKGAVELLDDGQVLDLLVEGEVFGQFSLLAHEVPVAHGARAGGHALLPRARAEPRDPVLETHAGLSFVIGSMRRRIALGLPMRPPTCPTPALRPVGDLVRREPVTAEPRPSVAEAAARDGRRAGLLAARPDARRLGHRDRPRPAHEGRRHADAIRRPRSRRSRRSRCGRSADDALAGDALLAMFAQGVHHFPVTGTGGELIGVVTDTDLMGLGRHTPFAMKSAIERARRPTTSPRPDAISLDSSWRWCDASADPIDVGPCHRARRRRDHRAADRARDRRSRRPAVRVGMARARQRRAPRAGAAHRSGSRARLRPGRSGELEDADP